MRRLTIQLKTLGLATVGWSHPGPVKADIMFARRYRYDGAYTVYIPGTSFKGALRSSASRIAEAYGFTSCGETLVRHVHQTSGEVDFETCAVCHLFGYPGKGPSKILVDDLIPLENRNVDIYKVTHVGLDDTTLTRAEHKLYTVEVIPPHTIFEGSIEVDDSVSGGGVKLLMISLAELRLGRFGKNATVDLKVADGFDQLVGILGPEEARRFEGLGEWLWG
jgi:CRISPR/Cas system CSM-associated protein Csm3 (group 7 of RAMP superfamily)